MTDEKDINTIVAAMCRGFARYDANEVLQQNTDSDIDRNCQDRYYHSSKDRYDN